MTGMSREDGIYPCYAGQNAPPDNQDICATGWGTQFT